MNQEQLAIREQQKSSWNQFSAGWKKWDKLNMQFIAPVAKAIIEGVSPGNQQRILDVAGGTGEPGLTIAGMLKAGTVTIADLSPGMLAVAQEHAQLRGIKNIDTVVCDVCELPFADNSFDAITCRFGFMFFPDMQLAANELSRVLKPGGRIAVSVWNTPDTNFWITVMMGTIAKNMTLPSPPPGAPGMFRCAQPGMMSQLFATAGFKNMRDEAIPLNFHCETIDQYWSMMTEVGAPIVAALSKATPDTVQQIKTQVFELIHSRHGDHDIDIPASAVVTYAEK